MIGMRERERDCQGHERKEIYESEVRNSKEITLHGGDCERIQILWEEMDFEVAGAWEVRDCESKGKEREAVSE